MRKGLFIAAVALLLFSGVQAQEKEMALRQYGFWDNWFIQGQVGAAYTSGEASFGKLISPTGAVSGGKYFSPAVGARLQIGGWEGKAKKVSQDINYKWNYGAVYLDALFNLNNIFAPYRENRFFNLVTLFGLGYNHGFKNLPYTSKATENIVARAGLQGNFRLSEAIDLNLEANMNALHDDFNSKPGGKYDWYVNVMAGITYKFKNYDGGRGFKLVEAADLSLIKSLNDKINEQRATIDNYKPCPEVEPCPETETVVVNNKGLLSTSVTFRLGKSTIDPLQEVNVYNVAQYMKANEDITLLVTGYADAKTGNDKINQKLSEKRAQNVADMLIKKMDIPANRIKVQSKGSSVQPFSTNSWNRVVIFIAE